MRVLDRVGARCVRLAVGLAVLVCGALCWSVPALAGSGFVPVSSFAAPPEGFAAPVGIAVNNTSGLLAGDVYVVDAGKSTLERFSALGAWESDSVEVPGVSSWLAVDENTGLLEGDVYAAVPGSGVVDRFSPGLVQEAQIKGLSEPSGVAVDAAGDVFVSEPAAGKVLEFNAAGEPVDATGAKDAANTVIEGLNGPQALAATTTGDLYIATAEGTVGYALSGGAYTRVEPPLDPGSSGVSVAPSGNVFVDRGNEFADYQAGALAGIGGQGPLGGGGEGIAVNGSTHDVYVANVEADTVNVFEEGPTPQAPTTETGQVKGNTLTLKGTLAADTTGYYFAYNTGESCEGGPTSTPEAATSGPVSSEVSGLQALTKYTYCLVATSAFGTAIGNAISLETGSVPAEITGESFSEVGPHGATLTAQVNPENLPGTYHYTYGPPSTFNTTPKTTPEVSYEKNPFTATAELSGLEPNTEYDFQLQTTNTKQETAHGEVLTLKTLPITPPGLPDNRAFEMVTPVENHNADVFIPHAINSQVTINGTPTYQPFQVSENGMAITYVADPTAGGVGNSGNGLGNQYLAKRSPQGAWTQTNIEPASRKATTYQGFSSDLSTGVVLSGREGAPRLPPLSSEAPGEGYGVLYACAESENTCTSPEEILGTPQNPFKALFVGSPVRPVEEFGTQGFERRGLGVIHDGHPEVTPVYAGSAGSASAGLLFEANDALLRGNGNLERELTRSVSSEIANNEDGNYLYDSVNGQLNLVDVLPGGEVVGDATFGGPPFAGNEFDPPDFSNVISGDGSYVYWTDLRTGTVYVRVSGQSTLQVSAGTNAAQYWTSTANGQYTFYTESQVRGAGEGLYRFNATTSTRQQLVPSSANVLGVVGTSENGEDIYFVAEGVLSGASGSGALPKAGQPNLYLQHNLDTPVFIATLSPQDRGEMAPFISSRNEGTGEFGDWQPDLANRTAEVPASGGGVVFMSRMSLPVVGFPRGYSIEGSEEVYVFDASANRLFCVSCSSSGEPGGASGFLPISWTDTYIPQWISSNGDEVFFDSGAPLVAQDTNGHQDVYEWELEGTGGCPTGTGVNGGCVSLLSGGTGDTASWLIGASESGDDVFIATRAQLVPEDQNGAFDLYDARVNGVKPVSPPACAGSGCQGVPAAPPTFTAPPSVAAEGIGNLPPISTAQQKPLTRAQKLSRALKACRKEAIKHSRGSCERNARKRYGPPKVRKKTKVKNGKGTKVDRHASKEVR
jgi:hypothetical protein